MKSTGDGFLMTFDGPARAIRCACAVLDSSKAAHELKGVPDVWELYAVS